MNFDETDLAEMERAVSDCCGFGSLANDLVWDDGGPESGPHLSCQPSAATMLEELLDLMAWIGTPDFRVKAGPYFGVRQPFPGHSHGDFGMVEVCYWHDVEGGEV